jgi:amino acid permease
MTPVTPLGRCIAALASMSGILVLAIPVSIISTNFNSEFSKLARQKEQVKARMALLSKHFRCVYCARPACLRGKPLFYPACAHHPTFPPPQGKQDWP